MKSALKWDVFVSSQIPAVTGDLPPGVNVPFAVSLSCLVCLSRRFPAAVSLILMVAVPAAENAR